MDTHLPVNQNLQASASLASPCPLLLLLLLQQFKPDTNPSVSVSKPIARPVSHPTKINSNSLGASTTWSRFKFPRLAPKGSFPMLYHMIV